MLDSDLQLRMKVVFILCAYLLTFFPRFLLRFGLHSVWSKKCWIRSSTWILDYFDICNKKVYMQTLTLVAVLNAWASVGALEEGSLFMSRLLKVVHVFVGSSMVDRCAKSGSMERCMQRVQQDALEEHDLLKFHTCRVCHALAWKHPLALHFLGIFIWNDVVCLAC
jgi:hypothetical protein